MLVRSKTRSPGSLVTVKLLLEFTLESEEDMGESIGVV
jgi:hypothetical protein